MKYWLQHSYSRAELASMLLAFTLADEHEGMLAQLITVVTVLVLARIFVVVLETRARRSGIQIEVEE